VSKDEDLVAIEIDENRCVGIGVCVDTEPDAVILDDEAISRPVEGIRLRRERAQRLCDLCPSGAISIRPDRH
jgi:ferredoxin